MHLLLSMWVSGKSCTTEPGMSKSLILSLDSEKLGDQKIKNKKGKEKLGDVF